MELHSSLAEDLVIKTRKPYTITKQRERWTEEEHNRFLEALKLYGRAWQRIEEHIGTKTAVQIRSHAQKFFSKLEKEAISKGVPIAQAVDIEIPPPRPKRKPSNPYPRKTYPSDPMPQRPNDDDEPTKVNQDDDNCSEVLTLTQDGHCSSMTSVNRHSIPESVKLRNSCSFREFVPTQNKDNGTSKVSQLENSNRSHEKLPTDDPMQITQQYPRHVPVHVVDGSVGACNQTATTENRHNEQLTSHQSFPAFHPGFSSIQQNQGDYRSRFHISPTFSNLIVSTLMQNPAAHAAASYATTFWPYGNLENSTDSPGPSVFSSSQMGSAPSITAIAAATVAAATAWWAAHGLLPLCHAPLHAAFNCGPHAPASTTETGQAPSANTDVKDNINNHTQQNEHSEAIQAERSPSKTTILSSDSEESGGGNLDTGSKAEHEKATDETEPNDDQNKEKSKKQVDRSSCGSNTASSSEVETDALEKHEKGNEEPKEADANNSAAEFGNRRGGRVSSSTSNINDSWKAVSEEGRIAFQALFSREILPQSFSPPHLKTNGQQQVNTYCQQNTGKKDGNTLFLDLNCKTGDSSSGEAMLKNSTPREGLLTIGLEYGKLKAHRTGFKPYKRCAMENRVANTSSQAEEKGPKRIRLEGEASI